MDEAFEWEAAADAGMALDRLPSLFILMDVASCFRVDTTAAQRIIDIWMDLDLVSEADWDDGVSYYEVTETPSHLSSQRKEVDLHPTLDMI